MRLLRHTGIVAGLTAALMACSPAERAEAPVGGDREIEAAPLVSDAGPVAIELFTSQGCSSCPPADRLVAELVDDPGLVIISRPVTYWDRLGWRDTLAREENTRLQRAYADNLIRGGGRSYTPQAVVNGRVGLVGSRRQELEAAIAEARETQARISIDVEGDPASGFRVTIDGEPKGAATVRLLALDRSETVGIGRGENGGRSVTYTNVLRDERDLARWTGGVLPLIVAGDHLISAEDDRRAVVVRQGAAGPILAARYLGS
ncbi:DUF1223 domain-containing protein [Parasphingopyxis algicola]|uniref:DUF1223 domain-containing protein n=1 Tax=Parasphingopyxis algicola TaxID=2026624 RepID=UPI0015A0F298|nr:DUF1223 domain-containing protein [Parasphingopyxis algicola]QLC24059.1 DUF1223 domain-containing protein [Parasphingopyxis algicola]